MIAGQYHVIAFRIAKQGCDTAGKTSVQSGRRLSARQRRPPAAPRSSSQAFRSEVSTMDMSCELRVPYILDLDRLSSNPLGI